MEKKLLLFVCIVSIAIFVSGCSMTGNMSLTGSESQCDTIHDCACGVHIKNGNCFLGNKMYVNQTDICPDFCKFRFDCVNGQCEMFSK
jgi:hypothetical protein